MISSALGNYLREPTRGSVTSLREEREERNENIPSIRDLLEKYQRYRVNMEGLVGASQLFLILLKKMFAPKPAYVTL